MLVRTTAALALSAALGLSGAAFAQSTGAPAGRPAATAPGGTDGTAGAVNEEQAVRSGDAIPASPGVGTPVETAPPPGAAVAPPPPPRN